ncbi:MAG: hypothetical protein QF779_07675, partial [SAR324 cluster bacterium]|nr:hypothetical protein [SAR324 cluster bacterium]
TRKPEPGERSLLQERCRTPAPAMPSECYRLRAGLCSRKSQIIEGRGRTSRSLPHLHGPVCLRTGFLPPQPATGAKPRTPLERP